MSFKKVSTRVNMSGSPESMFRDLRDRNVEGLLSHQADILRDYFEVQAGKSDIAFQLPTGSGKTLVGLLVAEWRRRRFGERVVYLCANRQLANQVVEQSRNRYGINSALFIGPSKEFKPKEKAAYQTGETIAVTTYSGLFNANPFFSEPQSIILDDAHAAEDFIASFWSMSIEKWKSGHQPIFNSVMALFRNAIPTDAYRRIIDEPTGYNDSTWVYKVPTSYFQEFASDLKGICRELTLPFDLLHSFNKLQDHFHACHIYMTMGHILIRPIIPPSLTHDPFAGAKQRIYMSATLGDGGMLERSIGVADITRLHTPLGWEKQGTGRRLFLLPELSLEERECTEVIGDLLKIAGRSLILTPSNKAARKAEEWVTKTINYPVINAEMLEQSKETFTSKEQAVAVLANRYDGLDLYKDECRLLLLENINRAFNLQERFLISCLCATTLVLERTLTRIVQAIGRCTRSATDYSAVIITGQSLRDLILPTEKRRLLHPELQAELDFGIEQSKDVSAEDFTNYLNSFLEQGNDWKSAEEEIINLRESCVQEDYPDIKDLGLSVSHEIKYQDAIWKGNYSMALKHAQAVIETLRSPGLRGYRAFWNYLAGNAALLASKQNQPELLSQVSFHYAQAAKSADIPWAHSLLKAAVPISNTTSIETQQVVQRIEELFERLGTTTSKKFDKMIATIQEGLHSEDTCKFENSHKLLGDLLGYNSGNSSEASSPDPWWLVNDSYGFVFEDYSGASETSAIGSVKVRQAASHDKWLCDSLGLKESVTLIKIMITPATLIHEDARIFGKDVFYWNLSDFQNFAREAIALAHELKNDFHGPGDLAWRANAATKFEQQGFAPKELAKRLMLMPLSKLPTP